MTVSSPDFEPDERPPGDLRIVEATDDRRVILLSPRGLPQIGIGCMVSMFLPAAWFGAGFVVFYMAPKDIGALLWLLGAVVLFLIAAPVFAIWKYKTMRDSEKLLILQPARITLRALRFDQKTGEQVDCKEESIEIGPGSGVVLNDSVFQDSRHSISLVVWGSSESLDLSMFSEPAEAEWLNRELTDWLSRWPTDETRSENTIRQLAPLPNRTPWPNRLLTRRRTRTARKRLSTDSKIQVLSETEEQLVLRVGPGGVEARSQCFGLIAAVLAFTAALGFVWFGPWDVLLNDWVGRIGKAIMLIVFGAFWLVFVVLLLDAFRQCVETITLDLTRERCVITRTIFGFVRRREFAFGTSPIVVLKANNWENRRPIPTICVEGAEGLAKFGTMLSDEEKRWLVTRLREFLKCNPNENLFAKSDIADIEDFI